MILTASLALVVVYTQGSFAFGMQQSGNASTYFPLIPKKSSPSFPLIPSVWSAGMNCSRTPSWFTVTVLEAPPSSVMKFTCTVRSSPQLQSGATGASVVPAVPSYWMVSSPVPSLKLVLNFFIMKCLFI